MLDLLGSVHGKMRSSFRWIVFVDKDVVPVTAET